MTKEIIAADLWALLLLAAYLILPKVFPKISKFKRSAWITIAGVALIARLVPNIILPFGAEYDINSFQIVGKLVIVGENVYSNQEAVNRHPYLPLQMYWMAISEKISTLINVSYVKIVRLAPIIADVLIALLIYQMLKNQIGSQGAFFAGLLYSLNPIPVFVSAYHGQFDSLATLFIVLSIYYSAKSVWASGGWMGLAILTKSWPVLTLPPLLRTQRTWKRRFLFLIFAVGIPLAGVVVYSIVFSAELRLVLERALTYNRGVGVWGYTYFYRLLAMYKPWGKVIFDWIISYGRYLTLIGLGIVWFLRARKETPVASILTIIVSFFALSHAFAIQYLMWLIPFAILSQDFVWLRRYTIAAFIYMFLTYSTFILSSSITNIMPLPQADIFIIMVFGLPTWVVTIAWMIGRLCGYRVKPSDEYLQNLSN